jgi:hypothetical protein
LKATAGCSTNRARAIVTPSKACECQDWLASNSSTGSFPRGATDDPTYEAQDQRAAVVSPERQRPGAVRRSVAQAGNTGRRHRKWFALDCRSIRLRTATG